MDNESQGTIGDAQNITKLTQLIYTKCMCVQIFIALIITLMILLQHMQ